MKKLLLLLAINIVAAIELYPQFPAQPYPAQPYPAQPYPEQPYPAQPYPAQPYPAVQPYYEPIEQEGEWTMVPDGYGNWHLVNMNDVALALEVEPRAPLVVVFTLFTRRNPNDGQVIAPSAQILAKSNFDPRKPTRIITHGWRNSASSPVNTLIRTAYLARGDFNVIVTDWSSGASGINYISSRNKVPEVGQRIAELVDFLYKEAKMPLSTLYLIGHSLGAHASGMAGKKIKSGKVNTIIGMDPAAPLFSIKKPDDRLDSKDATYVESIHTNTAMLGFSQPIGQASFYANWGNKQPGCGLDITGSCSHGRSYEYFAESISENNNFIAIRCKDYDDILNKKCGTAADSKIIKLGGEPSNSAASLFGVFYVPTNAQAPFGMGKLK